MKKLFLFSFLLLAPFILTNKAKADTINLTPMLVSADQQSSALSVNVEESTTRADKKQTDDSPTHKLFGIGTVAAITGVFLVPELMWGRKHPTSVARLDADPNGVIGTPSVVGVQTGQDPTSSGSSNITSNGSGNTTSNGAVSTTANNKGVLSVDFSSFGAHSAIVLTSDVSSKQNSTGNGSPVPEPATIGLLALGMTGFSAYARRRNKGKAMKM